MGESQIKVGDVVAWADVPIGALVVDEDACFFNESAAELFALAHPTP